jgi:hypothetical protein
MRDVRKLGSVLLTIAGLGLGADEPRRSEPRRGDAALLHGSIHLRIDDPANPRRRSLRLDQLGDLPLKTRDQFRIEVRLNRPAYLYVVWLGSDGKVGSIYPWAAGRWERRPAQEIKADRLDLPLPLDKAWEIPAGDPGLEAVVLLAREESHLPRDRDIDLAKLATGLPPQPRSSLSTAVWIENGREVILDQQDRSAPSPKTRKSDDPVLRLRGLLREKVQPLGDYNEAVLFPNQVAP